MSNDDITWLDADTYVTSDGVHHRLSGVDAPEVAHISKGGTLYLGSDVGETEAMKRLQQEGGFTSNVDLGEKTYDREVSDLLNSQGTSLRDTAFIHNIIPPTPDSAANIPTELYQRKLDRESAMKILGIDKSSTELPTVDQKAEEIRQRLETQRVEAGFTRMPQMMVPDPQTYVAIKGATGRQAQQKAVEEIERIKDLMSGQSIYGMPSPAAYQKLEQELRQQQEALMFATLNPNRIVSGSATQPSDRTRDNESRNPITDSLVNSLEDLTYIPGQLAEGLSNYNEDWKALKQWGQSRTWNQKFDQRKRASLPSFADVREEWSNDEFNWKDISTTASALTSTLAGSLPQMALMMMKTPGMIANMAVYTGQYYAEQPENDKSLALALAGAIPSAILDQLGFESMVGAKFLTNKADRDLVVSTYSSKYGVSLKEAEKALEGATKKTLLRLAGWSKDVAQRQIGTFPASAKKIGEAALAEGMTETMQQALEILANHGSFHSLNHPSLCPFEFLKGGICDWSPEPRSLQGSLFQLVFDRTDII